METVSIVILAMCGLLIVRNQMAYNYQEKVLNAVHRRNIVSIDKGERGFPAKVQRRWDEYNKVSYSKMVLVFWRKPSSFYDQDFLQEIGLK